MTQKGDTSMFSSGLRLSFLIAGTTLGSMACSDSAPADGVDGTMTSSLGATSGATTGTGGGATMGGTTTGTTATTGTMVGGTTTTTSTTGAGGTTSTSSATTSATSTGGMGTATSAGGMGAAAGGAGMAAGGASTTGMGGATSTGAGGTAGNAGEDFNPMATDFECIANWDQVLGFRITNKLGHLEEALAVAQSPNGGVYPVGTIIQHLPTEAMVKRAAGFSPETKDWEFFVLALSPEGETTISARGTTEIMTMGNTCASCHSMAPDQWDFICNTWGNEGGGNCGFDFMDSFLEQELAGDTRCD